MTIETRLRLGLAALTLLASAVAADAQSSMTPPPAAQFTPTQRSTIYQRVVGTLPPLAAPETHVNIAIGDRVPNTIPLYEMPDPATAELPAAKRYRYTVVNNEVMVVDPETNRVVEIHRQ